MTLGEWDYRVINAFRAREFKDYRGKKVKLDYEDHVFEVEGRAAGDWHAGNPRFREACLTSGC